MSGARERSVALQLPDGAAEVPGAGISGDVGGISVLAGTAEFAGGGRSAAAVGPRRAPARQPGGGHERLRRRGRRPRGCPRAGRPHPAETPRVIRSLRRAGVRRVVMVTGDHYGVADLVAAAIGVDGVLAERTPADKVDAVIGENARRGWHPRHGRRRHQRRSGPGQRGRRRGHGRPRRHGQLGGGRRRHHGRPARPAPGGASASPAAPAHRPARASSSAWASRSRPCSWRRPASCSRWRVPWSRRPSTSSSSSTPCVPSPAASSAPRRSPAGAT